MNTLETNLTDITSAASSVNPHLTAGDMGSRITIADTNLGYVQEAFNIFEAKIVQAIELL